MQVGSPTSSSVQVYAGVGGSLQAYVNDVHVTVNTILDSVAITLAGK